MKRSNFIDQASFRIKNRKWLRYSSNIARRILAVLEESDTIDRTILAKRLQVSRQYLSKVLQGGENLSLQTIANLSEALGVELITFPEYKDSYKRSATPFPGINYHDSFQRLNPEKIKDEENKSKEIIVNNTEFTTTYKSREAA
ncbi:MAG: helix-turn-helix transcriptional regulator [Bacteroidota bacterium]|nr:helix-turn-helix transcriptional regulator [Bacteroidota bacterium]